MLAPVEDACFTIRKLSPRRSQENLLFREQRRVLDHPTEFLFGGVVVRSLMAVGAGHFFVIHREAFQSHDAKIAIAFFPNLTLFQFHSNRVVAEWKRSLAADPARVCSQPGIGTQRRRCKIQRRVSDASVVGLSVALAAVDRDSGNAGALRIVVPGFEALIHGKHFDAAREAVVAVRNSALPERRWNN
jgi:hypothetical protein